MVVLLAINSIIVFTGFQLGLLLNHVNNTAVMKPKRVCQYYRKRFDENVCFTEFL